MLRFLNYLRRKRMKYSNSKVWEVTRKSKDVFSSIRRFCKSSQDSCVKHNCRVPFQKTFAR